MSRPPRPTNARLLPLRLVAWGVFQGVIVLAFVLAVYVGGHLLQMPADEMRALAYFALVSGILALVLVNRSFASSLREAVRRPNTTLTVIWCLIAAMLASSLLLPSVGGIFGFGPLHVPALSMAIAIGLPVLTVCEACKPFFRFAESGSTNSNGSWAIKAHY